MPSENAQLMAKIGANSPPRPIDVCVGRAGLGYRRARVEALIACFGEATYGCVYRLTATVGVSATYMALLIQMTFENGKASSRAK